MKLGALIARTERRLRAARLHYGHGTGNPHDEAAWLVLRGLGLPFDAPLEREADAGRVEGLIRERIEKRIPAAYLLKEAWLDGVRTVINDRLLHPRTAVGIDTDGNRLLFLVIEWLVYERDGARRVLNGLRSRTRRVRPA